MGAAWGCFDFVLAAEHEAAMDGRKVNQGMPAASCCGIKDEMAIENALSLWISAWQELNAGAYSSFYSAEYATPKWIKKRAAVFTAAANVNITLSNQKINVLPNGQAVVLFNQRYQSDTYSDYTEKTLLLKKQAGVWKIASETSRPLPAAKRPLDSTVLGPAPVPQRLPLNSAEGLSAKREDPHERGATTRLPDAKALAPESTPDSPVVVSKRRLSLSPAMKAMLSAGIELDVMLQNKDADHPNDAAQIITGRAFVQLQQDGGFMLTSYRPVSNTLDVELSPALKARLMAITQGAFAPDGRLQIDPDTVLQLNPLKMTLDLQVNRDGFGVLLRPRSSLLGSATSNMPSGLINYNLNLSHSSSSYSSQSSAYLRLNSLKSIGEHHLLLDASAYTPVAAGKESVVLDRVQYERDFSGRRLALGMMDGWSLQSLGQVSTLNGSQLWGGSYGSVTQSLKRDASQSLIPVQVYLPAAGEVRIYRDGRLLGVQQKAMGNHELDASGFPAGVYEIKAEVIVAGQVHSSGMHRINKPYGSGPAGDLRWQVWGGMRRDSSSYSVRGAQDNHSSAVGGVSIGGRHWDATWNLSAYYNRNTLVEEAYLGYSVFDGLNVNLQNIIASDGTRRLITGLNASLPYKLGSLSYSQEKAARGSRLSLWSELRENINASFYLSSLYARAGSLNLSYIRSGEGYRSRLQRRWDYNQRLYSGRIGFLSLNLGNSYNSAGYGGNDTSERYIGLNLAIPLGASFSAAYSLNEGRSNTDLSLGRSFDGPVSYASAGVSMQAGEGRDMTSYSGFAVFDTRIVSGSMSAMMGEDNSSFSIMSGGTMGWAEGRAGFGGSRANAGMVIDVPVNDGDDDAAEAKINNRVYPLSAGRNFVALPPYENYEIEVASTGNGTGSYEIGTERQLVTLYPGNVSYFQPGIKSMVTVFGRLLLPDGQPLTLANIKNPAGTAQSSADGRFTIDVDRRRPEVVVDVMGVPHTVKIHLTGEQSGALLLDDVTLTSAEVSTRVSPRRGA